MTSLTDSIILILFLFFFYSGWTKGFLLTILGPVSLVICVAAGIIYFYNSNNFLIAVLIMLVGPFVVNFSLSVVIKFMNKTFNKEADPSLASCAAGGFINTFWRGALVLVMLVYFTLIPSGVPLVGPVKESILRSQSYNLMGKWLVARMPQVAMDPDKLTRALKDPETLKKISESPEFRDVFSDERFQAMLADKTITEGLKKKDIGNLMNNPNVKSMFQDPRFLKNVFALNKVIAKQSASAHPRALDDVDGKY